MMSDNYTLAGNVPQSIKVHFNDTFDTQKGSDNIQSKDDVCLCTAT